MSDETQYSAEFVTLCSLISGVGGVVAGHWLQLWQARRSEYNEIADRLFLKVDGPVKRDYVTVFPLPGDDRKLIRRRMGWWKRRCFDQAVEKLNDAMHKKERDGPMWRYTHIEEVNAARAALASILSRH